MPARKEQRLATPSSLPNSLRTQATKGDQRLGQAGSLDLGNERRVVWTLHPPQQWGPWHATQRRAVPPPGGRGSGQLSQKPLSLLPAPGRANSPVQAPNRSSLATASLPSSATVSFLTSFLQM